MKIIARLNEGDSLSKAIITYRYLIFPINNKTRKVFQRPFRVFMLCFSLGPFHWSNEFFIDGDEGREIVTAAHMS